MGGFVAAVTHGRPGRARPADGDDCLAGDGKRLASERASAQEAAGRQSTGGKESRGEEIGYRNQKTINDEGPTSVGQGEVGGLGRGANKERFACLPGRAGFSGAQVEEEEGRRDEIWCRRLRGGERARARGEGRGSLHYSTSRLCAGLAEKNGDVMRRHREGRPAWPWKQSRADRQTASLAQKSGRVMRAIASGEGKAGIGRHRQAVAGKTNKGRVGEGKSPRVAGRRGLVWLAAATKVAGEQGRETQARTWSMRSGRSSAQQKLVQPTSLEPRFNWFNCTYTSLVCLPVAMSLTVGG